MKLGIFTVVFKEHPLAEAVQRIAKHGFRAVNLNVNFDHPDTTFLTRPIDENVAKATAGHFHARGIEIAALSGYVNFIDPNPAQRQAQLARFQMLLKHCRDFGTTVLATGSGTLSPVGPWAYHPENRSEAAWQHFKETIAPFVVQAEDAGVTIALEPFIQHVVYDIASVERLFNEITSPALQLVMDPTNYFSRENIGEMDQTLDELCQRLGSRTVVAHAKDILLSDEPASPDTSNELPDMGRDYPAAGRGVLNYPRYLQLLYQRKPDTILLLEHLAEDDIDRAREHVLQAWPDSDPGKPCSNSP